MAPRKRDAARLAHDVASIRAIRFELDLYDAKPKRWMIDAIRDGEAALRAFRGEIELALSDRKRKCAHCQTPIVGRSDRIYCSGRCSVAAHRARVKAGTKPKRRR